MGGRGTKYQGLVRKLVGGGGLNSHVTEHVLG